MDYQLKGKRALITGSSKGIGKAAAKLLHEEGAEVILHGRSEQSVGPVLKELRGAKAVYGDLANAEGAASVVRQTEAIGPVDILVNNAGIFEPKDFFQIPDEDWLRFYEVNVLSGVRLSRALMPGMLERDWGRIIFISSESGINTPQEMIHYGMTKTAQLAVSRGLAELTKGTRVTVNSVLPGPTMSDGVDVFVESFARSQNVDREKFEKEIFFKEARPTSLLQRFADPLEVAHMIVYIASPLSSATNGAALRVDGVGVKSII